MSYMFNGATSLTSLDVSGWNVSSVTTMSYMFQNVTLNPVSYSNILTSWSQQNLKPGVVFHGGNSKYYTGVPATARQSIIDTYGWTITDGGELAPTAFNDAANGNWRSGATWGMAGAVEGTDFPSRYDLVTVDSHTVTLGTGATVAGVTVGGSGTLDLGGKNITVTGSFAVNDGGTLKLKGNETVSPTPTFSANSTTVYTGTGSYQGLAAGYDYGNLQLNNGLVGYWKLDDGPGSTKARDDSGNGNHGTLMNGPTWSTNTPTTSFYNPYSMEFDGVNDTIAIPRSISLEPNTITISIWAKRLGDSSSTKHGLISKLFKNANSVPHASYGIYYDRNNNNQIELFLGYTDGSFVSYYSSDLPLNEWMHFSGVYDLSNVKLYIDGSLANTYSATKPIKFDSDSIFIGSKSPTTSAPDWYNGLLDDVRIYNRALSASEVAALAAGNPSTGSGVYVLGSALNLSGDMGLRTGGLRTNNGEDVTVAGDWSNNGSFVSTGAVILNGTGNQTWSGSTIFQNLTAQANGVNRTIFFDYRGSQRAQEALVLRGTASNTLTVRSTKAGSGAKVSLAVAGTQLASDIAYLNVQDMNATNGQQLRCDATEEGCINGGNNVNWLFDTVTPELAEVTPVETYTLDPTPEYVFSSTKAGTITYGGGCTSSVTEAIVGENIVIFGPLPDDDYNACTITVTDALGNVSVPLNVSAFTVYTGVSISGTVWDDSNGNGARDDNEAGLENLAMLLSGQTYTGATLERTQRTDASGAYAFTAMRRSNGSGYTVALDPGDIPLHSLTTTGTSSGILLGTGASATFHIGLLRPSILTGAVFFDTNGNNLRDAGENSVFSGALLTLQGTTGTGGTLYRTTMTNASGAYVFDLLPTSASVFVLTLAIPDGYSPATTASRSVTIAVGGTAATEDIGLILTPVEEDDDDRPGQGPGGRRGKGPPVFVQIPGPPAETPPGTIPAMPGQAPAQPAPGTPATPPPIADTPTGIPGVYLPPETPDHLSTDGRGIDGIPEQQPAAPVAPSTLERAVGRIADVAETARLGLLEILATLEETGTRTVRAIAAIGNGAAAIAFDAVTETIAGIRSAGQMIAGGLQATGRIIATTLRDTGEGIALLTQYTGVTLRQNAEEAGRSVSHFVDALRSRTYDTAQSAALALRSAGIHVAADAVEIAGFAIDGLLTGTQRGMIFVWQSSTDYTARALQRRIDLIVRPSVTVAGATRDAVLLFARNTATIADTMSRNVIALGDLGRLRAVERVDLAGRQAEQFDREMWGQVEQVRQVALERTDLIAQRVEQFHIHLWRNMDETQRAARQLARELRPTRTVPEDTRHAAAPEERTYRTALKPDNNRLLLASLHLRITDTWNLPVTNTPVVLFSTPKISVTDDEGIATFRDVETGEHTLEVHLPGGAIETRQLIVEPPSGISPSELDQPLDVVLPVIQVRVAEPLHGSASTPPWLIPVIVLIALMGLSNMVLLALYIMKRR